MTIGERIKSLRKEQSLTQTELANKVGTTKQNIYKYENGIITNIPSDRLLAISNALNVSPAVFFDSANEKSTPQTERDVLKQKIIELLAQLTEDELKEAARYLAFLISSQEK